MNIYPLNSTQEDMLRESNMETMENGFQVTPYFEIPAERLSADDMAAACQKFLDTNHYAHVHLVRQEDGLFMISESTDMPNNVHRYKMTHSEWEQRQNEFARPFKLLEEPGVRVNVIETEQQTITCFSYCHIFFDGISMKLFVSGISNILNGIPIEDQDDIAAVWNREEIASYESEAYQRAKQVVCEKFKGHKYTDICRQTDNPWGQTLYACYLLDYDRMKTDGRNNGCCLHDDQSRTFRQTPARQRDGLFPEEPVVAHRRESRAERGRTDKSDAHHSLRHDAHPYLPLAPSDERPSGSSRRAGRHRDERQWHRYL